MRLVATPDSAKENYSADISEYLIEIYKKDKPYTITPIVRNVTIGKFCSIAPNVQIGLAPHPSKIYVSTHPIFFSNDNPSCVRIFRDDKIFDDSVPATIIENDVWIGSNVIIPGGIRIGTGCIVAAGSVVVKDVPPYAIVGGNPAQIIRYRFTEEQIKALLDSEWWDWPIDKIRTNLNGFSNFEEFQRIGGL
jgi:acetyltransferase-like isoleucine patch superfamily enzyme